jgi:hypothetical protein
MPVQLHVAFMRVNASTAQAATDHFVQGLGVLSDSRCPNFIKALSDNTSDPVFRIWEDFSLR